MPTRRTTARVPLRTRRCRPSRAVPSRATLTDRHAGAGARRTTRAFRRRAARRALLPVELGRREGRRRLRIESLLCEPRTELLGAARGGPPRPARGHGARRSTETGCVSPYSSPMNSNGTKGDAITAAAARRAPSTPASVAHPLAAGPVADVVVVLVEHDEAVAGKLRPRCGRGAGRGTTE